MHNNKTCLLDFNDLLTHGIKPYCAMQQHEKKGRASEHPYQTNKIRPCLKKLLNAVTVSKQLG